MNKIIFLLFSFMVSIQTALAYTLTKVSPINPKILVNMNDGESAKIDDIFKIYDGINFVAQVRVSMVRNNQFVARHMDGTVVQQIKPDTYSSLIFVRQNQGWAAGRLKLSFNLVTAMNQITMEQTDPLLSSKESVAMKGSDFGFELNGDFKLNNKWGIFASLGYESFKVSGQANGFVCGGSSSRECFVDLTYMTGAAGLKYYIERPYGNYWLGAGAKIKSPMSKSSNSINEVDLTYAHGVLLHGGLDYKTKSNIYIPVSAYYNYSLNTSDTVNQIQNIGITIGIGKSF